MIGVIVNPAEHGVVREFFELFKTPWEFYRKNRQYEVLICAGECQFEAEAKVILVYAGTKVELDDQGELPAKSRMRRSCFLTYQENRIPIYGDTVTFVARAGSFLIDESTKECAAYLDTNGGTPLLRIGYDLFAEVRTLLTKGQPPANAGVPALELHIALLRDLITGCGISLVEIPPVPEGFSFIACLTHDVDHPSIRRHKLDPTIVGFFWRAIFGSLVDIIRGWISLRAAARNWAAAIKLPFVYVGLAKDFWSDFADRYLEMEKGLPSTFFVIPRKNYAGRGIDTRAAALRAARYEARELAEIIRRLTAAGCEVGLHGIDAWLDSSAGREELEEVRCLTGVSEVGVRMHWLYYNENSPATLEKAGANYDSTSGYNDAVGYRAGTTQAFKPLEAERMLELPLHAMDTALFYVSYLGLSPKDATSVLERMVGNAVQHGGCLVVNWHDRSLAPERLWDAPYRDLVRDMRARGAWFATAAQTAAWFRKRRLVKFETDSSDSDVVRAKVPGGDSLPGLRLRIYEANDSNEINARRSEKYTDVAVEESMEATASSKAR